MRGWSQKTIDWYLRAGEHSQYPRLILEQILPRLSPGHTVLDIGCGPGVYALALAPYVDRVLALDKDPQVLDNLARLSDSRRLGNIVCLPYVWPHAPIGEKVDVIICALGSGEIMTSKEGLKAIFALGPKLVFLVAPGQYLPPFGWQPHRKRPAADAEDTLALLDQFNVSYSAQAISLDFGQPVGDMSEAAEFLAHFLDIPPFLAWKQAQAIALPHAHGLWLPNRRNMALITLEP